jgi:uncharacterized protein with FMN-binding domain
LVKKRYIASIVAAVAIIALVLVSCIIELEPPEFNNSPWGGTASPFNSTATGSSFGFKSNIVVTTTFRDGFISRIDVSHGDTPEYADSIIASAKEIALAANSFETSLFDGLAGATSTRRAFVLAGQATTETASAGGPITPPTPPTPPTPLDPWEDENGNSVTARGRASVSGYGVLGDTSPEDGKPLEVEVVVILGEIFRINVTEPNDETPGWGGAFLEKAVPLAQQRNGFDLETLRVVSNGIFSGAGDGEAHATYTMRAFILAGNEALRQAGADGVTDPDSGEFSTIKELTSD